MSEKPAEKRPRILPRLEQFPGRTSDNIRFGDCDLQGHVNNAVFATYFETGRVMFLREPNNELNPPGATSVVARLDISFQREMRFPGTVEIGTAIVEIGRSSYTFLQALFVDGQCTATAHVTTVMIDGTTRKARQLPADVIARLEAMRLRDA